MESGRAYVRPAYVPTPVCSSAGRAIRCSRMLVVQEFVSVDGFAADADGDFNFGDVIPDWSAVDADLNTD